MANFEEDKLTEKIIGCCYEVHSSLGPGFVEKIYAKALHHQLIIENLSFVAEKEFNVIFKDQLIGQFRCDLYPNILNSMNQYTIDEIRLQKSVKSIKKSV
ncbi:MAG TPA: GxxExxY protein [Mucilaginibacter sp.]|jgi:GxxExxY protein